MSFYYSQMLILQDSNEFIPLHQPINLRRKTIKMRKHSLKLASSEKKPNKLILYQKKQLQRTQPHQRYLHRYNQQTLLSLVNKTHEILKTNTLSKTKIQQKNKKDYERSQISARLYTRATSPQYMNSSYFSKPDTKTNPQNNLISKNHSGNKDKPEKPEEYLKNMMEESIKKRTPRKQVKYDIQTRQNSFRIPISNIRNRNNCYYREKDLTRSLYQSPKRPTTSHAPCAKKQEKQVRVISEALQPW